MIRFTNAPTAALGILAVMLLARIVHAETPTCKQTSMPFRLSWRLLDGNLEAKVSELRLPLRNRSYDVRFCVGYEMDLSDNEIFGDSGQQAARDNCSHQLEIVKQLGGRILRSTTASLVEDKFSEVQVLTSKVPLRGIPKVFVLSVNEVSRDPGKGVELNLYVVKLDSNLPGRICHYDSPTRSDKIKVHFYSAYNVPVRNTLIGRGCVSQGAADCRDRIRVEVEFDEHVQSTFNNCNELMAKLPQEISPSSSIPSPEAARQLVVRGDGELDDSGVLAYILLHGQARCELH